MQSPAKPIESPRPATGALARFVSNLSFRYKLLLLPLGAAVGFVVILLVSIMYGNRNQRLLTAVERLIQDSVARDRRAIATAFETTQRTAHLSTTMIVAAVILCLAVLIAVSLLVSRLVTASLREVVRITQAVAAGDLTVTIDAESRDETGMVLQAMKQMTEQLSSTIAQVHNGAGTVASAATQLSSSAGEVSQATSEQAA